VGGVMCTNLSTPTLSFSRRRESMAYTLSLYQQSGLGGQGRPWIPAFAGMTKFVVEAEVLA